MENKKDIGKAISDKLASLDKTPREKVWSGISYELQKKKKRRIAFFFFWTKTVGLLLVGVMAALYVYHKDGGFRLWPSNNTEAPVILDGNDKNTNDRNSNRENTGNGNTETDTKLTKENSAKTSDDYVQNAAGKSGNASKMTNTTGGKTKKMSANTNRKYRSGSKIGKAGKAKFSQLSKVSRKKAKRKSDISLAQETSNQAQNQARQNTANLFDPKSLQTDGLVNKDNELNTTKADSLLAKKEKDKKKKKEPKPEEETKKDSTETSDGFAKFYIDAFVSPTHYGYFSNGSTLDERLDNNATSAKIIMNYGIGLSYQLTERTTIRIGASRIKLQYQTNGAAVDTFNYAGIKYNPNVSNATIYAASNGAETMDIKQELTYTEIPLEGRYRFLDRKVGLSAIAGFSFLILNDNTVSIKTDSGSGQTIGKTNGLFDTSVSANLGFSIDYGIFKNTKIFLEPMLNYQAISFDNSNFKPYFFGAHFGIRYALINK